ncbi:hypothetical protein AVEN_23291-1 [Araneus ventricosus]|uniref:Uncharacterized protein n=1 Tax=Araneus ventricosus TaxID=182803 RepID=A0A4Y2GFW4_ARAVE|nr:hypothetical protein AVEN_23291-1 [Araneus ventricosus]
MLFSDPIDGARCELLKISHCHVILYCRRQCVLKDDMLENFSITRYQMRWQFFLKMAYLFIVYVRNCLNSIFPNRWADRGGLIRSRFISFDSFKWGYVKDWCARHLFTKLQELEQRITTAFNL